MMDKSDQKKGFFTRFRWFIIGLAVVLVVSIILFLTGSSKTKWEKLSGNKLIQVTTDLCLADGMFLTNALGYDVSDSIKAGIYQDIFIKHGCTKTDYDSSMLWFSLNRPDAAEVIWDKVYANLMTKTTEIDTLMVRQDSITKQRENKLDFSDKYKVNLLATNGKRELIQVGDQMLQKMYSTTSDIHTEGGTQFVFNLGVLGPLAEVRQPLMMAIAVNTYGKTKIYKEKPVRNVGKVNKLAVTLPSDFENSSSTIYGYIYCKNGSMKKPTTLLIDSISIIKYKSKVKKNENVSNTSDSTLKNQALLMKKALLEVVNQGEHTKAHAESDPD